MPNNYVDRFNLGSDIRMIRDTTSGYITASSLAAVATSGAYSDLSGKPTSLKNPQALSLVVNGTTTSYDGSVARTVTINFSTQYELLWVNDELNFGNCTNVSPTISGKSWSNYSVFLMFYKNLWGGDGTDSDWLTQPIWKNVQTRIEPRGYDPNHLDYDVWRYVTITNSGFSNTKFGDTMDGYCVPMRIYGYKGLTYDQWV